MKKIGSLEYLGKYWRGFLSLFRKPHKIAIKAIEKTWSNEKWPLECCVTAIQGQTDWMLCPIRHCMEASIYICYGSLDDSIY